MVIETITPTELHPDLTKEQFLEFSEIQSMTEADAREMVDWLGVGTGKFNPQTAEFLFFEMGKNQQDSAKGWGRLSVLIAARMIYHQGNPGGKETVDLEDKVRESLSGIQDNVDEILAEGFTSREGTTTWYLTERPKTCLAETVKGVVDWWWQENDPQAQLEITKGLLVKQREINQEAIDLGRGYLIQYDTSERQLDEARKQIQELQQRLPAEGNEVWGDKEREAAAKIYNSLTKPIKEAISTYLREKDWIKEVGAEEVAVPEGAAKKDKELLDRMQRLEGLDRKVLHQIVDRKNNGEVLSALPEIMRLKLEERRKAQEQTRKDNREKKEVKDYFAEHEIKLIYDQDNSGFGVEKGLSEQLEKAQSLGVNIFEADKELSVSTGQTEVTDLSLILDPQGRLKTTKIKAATLRLEVFNNPKILEEEMISVFGSERKQESESNTYIFARGENGFVVKYNNAIIGKVSFNQTAGEMIINWQTQDGDLAGFSVAKRLNQEWNSGIAGLIDNKLGGFELKVVVEGGAEKTEEVKSEPVAIPAEPIVPVEAAPAPETASAEPVESVVPAPPVAEEAVSIAELPTPSKEAPKSEEEMPDWLRALQEAPFQPAEVSAKAEKPAAQPLLEPEAPKPNTDRQSLDF